MRPAQAHKEGVAHVGVREVADRRAQTVGEVRVLAMQKSYLKGLVCQVCYCPNKRLKLTARVDYGMNLSSARRSLSAIR